MKSFIAAVGVILAGLSLQPCYGQVDTTLYRSWSAGTVAGGQGYDSNLGLEVTSRGLFNGRVCLRLKGSRAWMETYKVLYNRWTTYHVMELTLVYQFHLIERVRPYIEVGMIEILPSESFSNARRVDGLACRAGLEMFIVKRPNFHLAYYFAGGANSVRAFAEKLDTNPRYAHGVAFGTGFRFYIRGAR